MENATDALKIAFGVFVFVIALTVTFSLVSQARQTADVVFEVEDDSKYLADGLEGITYLTAGSTERIVGWETIIPTVYRYDKENYGVTIMDSSENIVARFDAETEDVIAKWYEYNKFDTSKILIDNHINYLNKKVFGVEYSKEKWGDTFNNIYKLSSGKIGSPWRSANSEDTKKRLDADFSKNGYDVKVKYTNTSEYIGLRLLNKYPDAKFKESINVITQTKENEEVTQKIEIIYRQMYN